MRRLIPLSLPNDYPICKDCGKPKDCDTFAVSCEKCKYGTWTYNSLCERCSIGQPTNLKYNHKELYLGGSFMGDNKLVFDENTGIADFHSESGHSLTEGLCNCLRTKLEATLFRLENIRVPLYEHLIHPFWGDLGAPSTTANLPKELKIHKKKYFGS